MRHPLLRAASLFGISVLAACSSSAASHSDDGGTPTDAGTGEHRHDGASDADGGSDTDGSSDAEETDGGSDAEETDGSSDAEETDGDLDAEDGDGGSGTPWSCLGSQFSADGASITYTIKFVDRNTGAGKASLSATLCSTGTLLSDCHAGNTDVDAVFASGTTDAAGSVTFKVNLAAHNLNSDGVTGFVYLVDSSKAIYDQQVFVNFIENQNLVIRTMTPKQATAIASALNVTLDMTKRGILNGEVIDCNYNPAAGAKVTDDQQEKLNYFVGGAASPTAKATDTSGEYVVLNAQFTDTGLEWTNASADPVGGITVAPTSGMVTTVAIPHTD